MEFGIFKESDNATLGDSVSNETGHIFMNEDKNMIQVSTAIHNEFGNYIFNHDDYLKQDIFKEITAFPWLDTLEMNIKHPYFLFKPSSIFMVSITDLFGASRPFRNSELIITPSPG